MIYADQRWIGTHGIGRFARNVLAGLEYRPLSLTSNPAAPLESVRLARELCAASSKDVFFSPGYNTPLCSSAKLVFTIHDLSHVYCSENSSLAIQLYYATLLKRACRRASRILTVSTFTRLQIAEWARVSQDKVVNVSCGVDSKYRPDGTIYKLPFRYVLSVSNRKRHKNEFRMVEAFAKANLDPRMHLVFTGGGTTSLRRWIDRNHVAHRVDFIGVVDEDQLPALYRGAEAVLFASLYEGFGLPLLEAMACGIPVVTSNVTAMPETAGGAALFVDPTSVERMACALSRVVADHDLRDRLRENGLKRAAHFSWASTRNKVHRVLEEALMLP